METWDNIEYQRIKTASLIKDNWLDISFQNGDNIKIPLHKILPINIDKIDEGNLIFNEYEVKLQSNGAEVIVPWDNIRIVTDNDFAKHVAKQAEESARLIGLKLRRMRERKKIKSNELAFRAEVSPQTITRIEKGHTDLNFATLRKILAAMGYSLQDLAVEEVYLDTEENFYTWKFILKKLSKIGINNDLVKRIVPEDLTKLQSSEVPIPELIRIEISSYLTKVYNWDYESIWGNKPLEVSSEPTNLAFYKVPLKGNYSQIKAYSHYAYYLCKIVSKTTQISPTHDYPEDLEEFKAKFYDTYYELDLYNLLCYTWDMGISVLPLNDSGVFHGASWNIENKHVIVLKQRDNSHSRWIFDLLHELYHVFVHLEESNSGVIESEDINPFDNNDSPEELEANSFANQFIFGQKAEELAKRVLIKAEYKIELLKNSVLEVSREENIAPEYLANYLSFRLQAGGKNWWGTARSFQTTSPSPYNIALDILKDRVNMKNLNPIDRNLLSNALNN